MHLTIENGKPVLDISEGEAKELRISSEIRSANVTLRIKRSEDDKLDELNQVLAGSPVNASDVTKKFVQMIKANPVLTAAVSAGTLGYVLALLIG